MTTEQIKEKIEKREAELKALKKEAKDKELAEQKAKENLAKLEEKKADIVQAIEALLKKANIYLPDDKLMTISPSEAGLQIELSEIKKIRKTGEGRGGAKNITFEGQQISWAKLCEIKTIARTPSGSAHRDVYNKAKELHDSIEHECVIDGKKYPIAQS